MNELKRTVVLLVALVHALLERAGLLDPGLDSIRRELKALTVLLTHQSRAAAAYHLSSRGLAIEEMGENAVKGFPHSPDDIQRMQLELELMKAELATLKETPDA